MKTPKINVLFILLFIFQPIFSQQSENSVHLGKNLSKGKALCDNLNFKSVQEEATLKLCKSVYTEKHRYREALNVIEIAHQKFPYSYEVSLERALALNEVGSYREASNEISRLIKLYPEKFELHNYLARIQYNRDRVKSVMPFIVSVITAPDNPYASENIVFIKRLLNSKSKYRSNSNSHFKVLKNIGEDNFDLAQYKLSIGSENDEFNSKIYLIERIQVLCDALKHTSHTRKGFFWDTYAQYFLYLDQENEIEAAVHYMLNPNISRQFKSFQEFNSNSEIK